MSKMNIIEELEKLAEIRNKATPGEWHDMEHHAHLIASNQGPQLHYPDREGTYTLPICSVNRDASFPPQESKANSEFIKQTANNIQAIAQRMREIEKELTSMRKNSPQEEGYAVIFLNMLRGGR